jgi:large subunit ribosomal protein L18
MALSKTESRRKRRFRIRQRISGTAERPRLAVYRSHNHVYAQLIDDREGRTLLHVSTLSPELSEVRSKGGNVEAATQVGKLIAEKAKGAGFSRVVFDRGGYMYHGRVRAVAEAAREAGLEF